MEINSMIDSTKLGFTVTTDDVRKLCEEAKEYHFASVCIPPCYVEYAKQELQDSSVSVCNVVGFPFGNNTSEVKAYEAENAIAMGADEIDMVMNISALKEKSYDYVKEDIEEVRDICKGKILKVIIETSVLTEDEIRKATEICNETYVHFIKTSTGFGNRSTNIDDVKIINEVKSDVLEVKASGKIRTLTQVLDFMDVGVTRIGTSSGVDIMKEMDGEN